jgi:hypothetical protein
VQFILRIYVPHEEGLYGAGLIMGATQGKTRVALGGIKQKKGGLFTAQQSHAVMEVKTVTPDNEMCSDGAHKLGHCLRHHVELLHVVGQYEL